MEKAEKEGATPAPVELTDGFVLLGTPVGSEEFAKAFYATKAAEVAQNVAKLTAHIPDLQTRLRVFMMCTIQKMPHLLGSSIMHNLALDFEAQFWEEWNGPPSPAD